MKLFKVVPTRYGAEAPSLYIEASNKKEADSMISSRSGLRRFKDWWFEIIEIKELNDNRNKRDKNKED